MWINHFEISENSYELINKEVELVKKFIQENKILVKMAFKDTLIENKLDVESRPFNINDMYWLALKAIVTMKENWAKNINELDKLYCKTTTVSALNTEEQNKNISELQKEENQQQEKDLNKAKLLASKIKNTEDSKIIWDILENGNVNITREVKEKFINYWNSMWFSSSNPITILLQAIWENYLNEHETALIWFLMIQNYIKYDIEKWIYWWWINQGNQLEKSLLKIKDEDLQNFALIYPKILWEMFWEEFGERVRYKIASMWMHISKREEDSLLKSYYLVQA